MRRRMIALMRWSARRRPWLRCVMILPLSVCWCFVPNRIWDSMINEAFPQHAWPPR